MILVFGSINADMVTRAARLPRPGETVAGESFAVHPGGKGANQALAAARAGARVTMFGCVGDDALAATALSQLGASGMDLTGIARIKGTTGCAAIQVDATGENSIIVVAGANAQARAASVPDALLGPETLVVMQLEVPLAEVAALAARAKGRGARVLLNPAPYAEMDLAKVDYLVLNETEAAQLGDTRCAAQVIVTAGARGAWTMDRGRRLHVPAPAVEVVDTTGAGDTFVGCFAARLDAGDQLEAAMRHAVAAASLACTRGGAQ